MSTNNNHIKKKLALLTTIEEIKEEKKEIKEEKKEEKKEIKEKENIKRIPICDRIYNTLSLCGNN